MALPGDPAARSGQPARPADLAGGDRTPVHPPAAALSDHPDAHGAADGAHADGAGDPGGARPRAARRELVARRPGRYADDDEAEHRDVRHRRAEHALVVSAEPAACRLQPDRGWRRHRLPPGAGRRAAGPVPALGVRADRGGHVSGPITGGTGVTTVATSARTYTVTGREETLDAVLVIVPLVRASTGRPLPARGAQPSARTRHPHARARIVTGGILVIAGRPDLALRPPPAPSTTITVDLAVPGEPMISRDFSVPAGASLPVNEPAWELDDPVRTVTGAVRRTGFPFPAVPAATVAAGTGVPGAPFALALRTPLALDHPAGLPLRECTLTAGPSTTLAEPMAAGARTVVLASSAGIGAGAVLEFGDDPVREHVVVQGPGHGPDEVLLRTPVVHSAPSGAPIASFSAA